MACAKMPSKAGFFRRICAAARSVTAKRKRNKLALAIVGGLYAVVFLAGCPGKARTLPSKIKGGAEVF
jgi:hypothetical protein